VRRAALASLEDIAAGPPAAHAPRVRALLAAPHDGRAKMWVIRQALRVRREQSELFERGNYHPIAIGGARAHHALAYARTLGSRGVVAIAGRLFASLGPAVGAAPLGALAWADTAAGFGFLPPGTRLTNVLTGERLAIAEGALPLARAFAHFPGALLTYDTATD
jgi:(1->4)-alpha-D-glucan 1-alpha-D-glucosylmutase